MSKASDAARERMPQTLARVPTIQPVEAINRAKQGEGIPTAPTDPYSPNGVALVNGVPVTGQDTPYTALPAGLTLAARSALEGAGLTTLELARAQSDAELSAIDGVGPATIAALRAETP